MPLDEAARMLQRVRSFFASKSPVQFRHRDFGVLTRDSRVWGGQIHRDGRDIRFFVDGSLVAPNERLLDRVREVADRFATVESDALLLLQAQVPCADRKQFEFKSLDLLWEDRPHLYAFEFARAGDEHGIWRVEFENEKAKFVSRDD
ncbi:MAG: hypothetical protein QM754_12895 [Tepidisphaeraceae bacterium]